MKKLAILFSAFLVSQALSGQTTFGVKGGLNIASMNWTGPGGSEVDIESRLGLHIGALAHIHLTPNWAVQPELVYSQEGGIHAVSIGTSSAEFKYKNDYVNLPVMVQYMFNNGFRLEAGPQVGLLVSAKDEDTDGSSQSTKDIFETTNFGLGFGLNYLSKSGFGFGGRYNLGLSNIAEEGWGTAKGRVAQISLFYVFDRAHKANSR